MTRFLLVALALVILLPTAGYGRPASDFETVAFMTKEGIQVGQKIQIVANEFGDLTSCGETYTTVYRGRIANEFGESPRVIKIWGRNLLNGFYVIDKVWKGDGESDCAVMVRASSK